ncbi:excinuclease ABC subunit C [Chromatium okenii]|uniref:excinuclease ABC subunit UvrC n=1 Tax=Chromatium okenii TaxID=61644 RepID=UPI0019076B15|nr:excinuclease ABC subunit UvrC [Chromatium okenii]MBK1640667.1 excinuclease ABC subunit C [Chromatium okenii]
MAAPADLRPLLASLPLLPGVYRMLAADGAVLYVGKAKLLKRRVSSYFGRAQAGRIGRMVRLIADIQVTVTGSETEALLLESNLIKALQPRFNVLLRDDKSYPYLHLSAHEFPRLALYRGSRKIAGRLFGPYPSAGAVRETLQLLQKVLPVRQCEDSVFAHRSRPCLQYQIKRCTAPCVGLIDAATYAADVAQTVRFLDGRSAELVTELAAAMTQAAEVLEFERAAVLRDRLITLREMQRQHTLGDERGDLDIIALAQDGGLCAVLVCFIRGGRNLGTRSFFPQAPAETLPTTLLRGFLLQFYADKAVPPEVIVSVAPDELALLEQLLSDRAGQQVRIKTKVRTERARLLALAQENALVALHTRLARQSSYAQQLAALAAALELPMLPQRLECFDVSHTQGELPVASCVVFDATGAQTAEYRRFNIDGITPGDDYAALEMALMRRFQAPDLKSPQPPFFKGGLSSSPPFEKGGSGGISIPEVLFIDGGRGQLAVAARVVQALGITGMTLVGVAKGAERRPGTEQLWLLGLESAPVILPATAAVLHLIAHIRDEAHRFAITGHRQRRAKARTTSALEAIDGVGAKRRQQLLKQFGGLRGVAQADVATLAAVDGISPVLAQRIYAAFHDAPHT